MTSVQTSNLQNTANPYAGMQSPTTATAQVNNNVPATNYVPAYPTICYPPQYYCGSPICSSTCPAVEININNPMTHSGPLYVPQSPYVSQQQVCCTPMPVQNLVPQQTQVIQQPQQPQPQKVQSAPPAAASIKSQEQPNKDVVPLTDEYIKSLENYLNNPNADVRVVGIKELSARFKEDKTRRNDRALTNLLNKALRDPSQKVRLIALGILDADTAEGDKLTYQILQNMQRSNSNYNQDSVTASEVMLRKSGRKFNVQNTNNKSSKETKSQKGQNLNVTTG